MPPKRKHGSSTEGNSTFQPKPFAYDVDGGPVPIKDFPRPQTLVGNQNSMDEHSWSCLKPQPDQLLEPVTFRLIAVPNVWNLFKIELENPLEISDACPDSDVFPFYCVSGIRSMMPCVQNTTTQRVTRIALGCKPPMLRKFENKNIDVTIPSTAPGMEKKKTAVFMPTNKLCRLKPGKTFVGIGQRSLAVVQDFQLPVPYGFDIDLKTKGSSSFYRDRAEQARVFQPVFCRKIILMIHRQQASCRIGLRRWKMSPAKHITTTNTTKLTSMQ